ncbi:MAG: RNA polymerase sporulation sigma factor SigK [Bacilli bacterium]|nr:RNA polymerase sporulation sigma factor SigK [Bacilli bacterium]
MLSFLISLIKNIMYLGGSYSNTVFKEPLSKEEEEIVIKKMLNGDKNARNTLIEHNLRLVAHIVKKFESKNVDTDDLIGIGTIGLIKAVDSYTKDKDTRITTYAAKCIQNEILMHFRSNKKYLNTVSLDDTIGYDKDGNIISLIDVMENIDDSLDTKINLKENIELLQKYMNKLNNREKEIIIKRYGLNNTKEMTQKDIAKELHISRSYVSRIEKRAITKILKNFIKEKKC